MRFPDSLESAKTPAHKGPAAPRAPFARLRALIEEPRNVGIADIVFGHDGEAGADRRRDRVAREVGVSCDEAKVADLSRMLGDCELEGAVLQQSDDRLGRVEA